MVSKIWQILNLIFTAWFIPTVVIGGGGFLYSENSACHQIESADVIADQKIVSKINDIAEGYVFAVEDALTLDAMAKTFCELRRKQSNPICWQDIPESLGTLRNEHAVIMNRWSVRPLAKPLDDFLQVIYRLEDEVSSKIKQNYRINTNSPLATSLSAEEISELRNNAHKIKT